MLTRNDVLTITEPIETMYADCQAQLLINISKHFAGGYLPTAEWESKMLSEMGALTQESIEIIAANTGQAPEAIKKAITEGMGLEVADAEKVLKGAAKAGKIQGATESWQASPRVQSVVGSLTAQATEDFNVVNTVMLDSTRNRYAASIQYCKDEERRLIEKLMSANNAQELEGQLATVQRSLNASTASVAIGAEARQAAVRRTIKQLADQGITGYIDAGGHHWSPEAYINMDIRTTVHNAAIQGQQARSADYGVSTFQISSHAGARPLCEPYQGKFYSWDGSSGVVEDYNGKEYAYESIYDTTYEQPAGIFGINCGHSPQTFVSGYSIPRYEPTQDFDKNAEEYALSQRQRYMEREIRKSKTEALCHEASGDKEAFEKTAAKIKQQNANYKAFCSENGRTPRMDRTQVYGYNRSVSGKATQAAKKAEIKPFTPPTPKIPSVETSGAMRDIPRMIPLSPIEAAKDTNPLYNAASIYRENCANCVVAEEARVRGYDVRANPFDRKTKISYYWENGKKGKGSWTDSFVEEMPAINIGANRKPQQIGKIQDIMNGWGEDSRAVVFVKWDGREIGHYFMAYNTADGVKFVNPQRPDADAAEFFERTKPSATRLFRTDDKTFGEYIREVVTWDAKK